ncbi:MAG: DUF4345 domain-containing protein [Actinobacteria bacterium]|nr:DUF4345 domain-containing protein [Actinomycetota bacterium]
MSRNHSRRALQVFLTILGSVAIVTGATTVILGVDSIVGAERVSGTVDSEMRFYAVWYVGAGVLLLREGARVESAYRVITAIAALFFLAGCSRALSWAVVGRPHKLSIVLMMIELALPFVVVPWQRRIARPDTAGSNERRVAR